MPPPVPFPSKDARFPLIRTFVSDGELLALFIPPPKTARQSVTVTFVSVGELFSL